MLLSLPRLFARVLACASVAVSFALSAGEALASSGAVAVREALRFRGVRYRWGGLSTRGVDCSGLTTLVYRRLGVRLPRTARAQARVGTPVGRGRFRPGDLLFFRTKGRRISHVGIYVGGGKMIHAPRPGKRVGTVPVAGYFARRLAGARRLF